MKKITIEYRQEGNDFRMKNILYFEKLEELFQLLEKYRIEKGYTFYIRICEIVSVRSKNKLLEYLDATAKRHNFKNYQEAQENKLIEILINKGARKDYK